MKIKYLMMIILSAYGANSYAMWAVIDSYNLKQNTITATSTAASAKLEGYYLPKIDANTNATAKMNQAVNESLGVLNKTTVDNVLSQEIRLKKALGQAELVKRAVDNVPTIDQCIEMTNAEPGMAKGGAVASSNKGVGGGFHGLSSRSAAVVSTSSALGHVLAGKQELGTCTKELQGSPGCSGADGKFAKGDYQPRGIKGNIAGVSGDDNTKPTFNNFTLSEKDGSFTVAQKYLGNSTYYDKPKVPNKEALAKNPAYAALYTSMMAKLDAAGDTLTDILKMRRESDMKANTGIKDFWANVTEDKYKNITGLTKKPDAPSMFEVLNYQVQNDYLGAESAELNSIQELNKRTALSNMIGWNVYKQLENLNIMTAHMLVQQTTPVSKQQVDAEYNKTMSYK